MLNAGCRGARSILDLYNIYIGPLRFICLAMMCRLVRPAYWGLQGSTTCRLAKRKRRVVRASKNGGDNSFCHILVLFLSRFQVGADVQLYIQHQLDLFIRWLYDHPSRGEAQKVRMRQTPGNDIRKLRIWLYRYWTPRGGVYWTGGSMFITGGPI